MIKSTCISLFLFPGVLLFSRAEQQVVLYRTRFCRRALSFLEGVYEGSGLKDLLKSQ
ncbi:MAG: hypothetical protein WCQ69_00355 [Bacteroidales bacterium]|nr:hypothetical protein [Bacteroidales bacterium]MDD2832174.1 hypothetical protein [Bacteroidales bacterium]MDD3209069.1 hypothetical protein [Bacteroidales bacterium]MDD3697923.1 hypothetical protein [Bacteroidales bacterium]MDD4473355.1 hypothetical protein [Bacteroidales bacterium]